ncbi:MAG: CPBP family intramembrane glutamic endopeptidase [Ignavibacteriaceae bacterium]
MDKKVIFIFLAVCILQTISWYFTSRRFFRIYFFEALQSNSDVFLWEYLYWFATDFITLFILPVLIIKILFKEKIRDYGITLGDNKAGLTFSLLILFIMLPVIWFASSSPEFSETYPLLYSAKQSWRVFVTFEIGLFIYMFAWEFIWRGFMLFGLKEKFGYYAVLIQLIPFVILHNGKPVPETFGAIIAGIVLGALALRTGSIFYGIIAHAGVIFVIDLISTLRFKAEDYGTGISSFINIIRELTN